MFLSRAFLNPASAAVRADLADATALHRTVMRAFPDEAGPQPRRRLGVLHRVDAEPRRGRYILLVQSAVRPDFERLPSRYFLDLADVFDSEAASIGDNPSIREVNAERAHIGAGARFAFRLHANTTKKVPKVVHGVRTKNGTRVPLRGDDARLEWLGRQAERAGFRCHEVRVQELPSRFGRPPRRITLEGAVFEGALVVTDPDTFRTTLAEGIGPAKAFGFGLLSVTRLRST